MRTILVCLDGSPRAPGVLTAALSVARAYGGHLMLLRAMGIPAEVPQDLFKTTDRPLADIMRQHAEAYLADQMAHVPPDLRADSAREVHIGVPWDAICAVARERRADLVVIGSHGYGGLDRLLGTTAAKVVNHAPCSVLVVREAHPAAAAGSPRA